MDPLLLLGLFVVLLPLFWVVLPEMLADGKIATWAERRKLVVLESTRLYQPGPFDHLPRIFWEVITGSYVVYKVRVTIQGDDHPYTGYLLIPIWGGRFDLEFQEHWLGPRPGISLLVEQQREALPPDIASQPDPREAAIRQEVARRLDGISNNPEAMMAFDVDGDGTIDVQEWERARHMIDAEVRVHWGESSSSNQDDGTW